MRTGQTAVDHPRARLGVLDAAIRALIALRMTNVPCSGLVSVPGVLVVGHG